MKIRVINLARSADRRAAMVAQLGAAELPFEIFPAVDAASGDHLGFTPYDIRLTRLLGRRLLTAGEVAIAASHTALWRACAESGEPVIVMEDDITLLSGFRDAARAAIPLLGDYPMLRLSGLFRRKERTVRELGEGRRVVRHLKGPSGLQCYAFAPEGAARLLRHLKPLTVPIDDYFDMFWLHGVPSLALKPYAVSHESPYSTETTIDKSAWQNGAHMGRRFRREAARLVSDARRVLWNMGALRPGR